jgi:hypothetical protein
LTSLARLENTNVMFSKATPLPGKALAWLNEDHALLDIGPVSNRVQTGGLNDKRIEYMYSRG